jgi:hypothetical protein
MKPQNKQKAQAWLALVVFVLAGIIVMCALRVITPYLNYLIWGITAQ